MNEAPASVPLFPLPDHVLLLGVPRAYRILEPRYRHLVDDLIGREPRQRWLAIPRLAPGWEGHYLEAPAILPVCALALVRSIRPLEGGQFQILVEGVARCRLRELPSQHPYRLAEPQPLGDLPGVSDAAVASACARMLARIDELRERLGPQGERIAGLIGDRADVPALVERLGSALIGGTEARQHFLETRTLDQRIALLLAGVEAALAADDAVHRRWRPSPN